LWYNVLEPPTRFGEGQVRGPFARFAHVHEFEPRPGGTLLRERLEVRLPWWLGGEAAVRWIVAPRLRRYFAARHDRLARLAVAGALA
jgi:ligand-binding SRPBCC domain-containing protein